MRLYDNAVVMTPSEYEQVKSKHAMPIGKNNEFEPCGFSIGKDGLESVLIDGKLHDALVIYIQDKTGTIKPMHIYPEMGVFMTELEFVQMLDKSKKEHVWHEGEIEFVNNSPLLCIKDTSEEPAFNSKSWKAIIIQN